MSLVYSIDRFSVLIPWYEWLSSSIWLSEKLKEHIIKEDTDLLILSWVGIVCTDERNVSMQVVYELIRSWLHHLGGYARSRWKLVAEDYCTHPLHSFPTDNCTPIVCQTLQEVELLGICRYNRLIALYSFPTDHCTPIVCHTQQEVELRAIFRDYRRMLEIILYPVRINL